MCNKIIIKILDILSFLGRSIFYCQLSSRSIEPLLADDANRKAQFVYSWWYQTQRNNRRIHTHGPPATTRARERAQETRKRAGSRPRPVVMGHTTGSPEYPVTRNGGRSRVTCAIHHGPSGSRPTQEERLFSAQSPQLA